MAGGRYYNSDNDDMSRGSMNTEAWHGEIMGLKRGLQVRAASERNNDTDAPKDGSVPMADGDADSNAEDARNAKEAPHRAVQEDTGGMQKE